MNFFRCSKKRLLSVLRLSALLLAVLFVLSACNFRPSDELPEENTTEDTDTPPETPENTTNLPPVTGDDPTEPPVTTEPPTDTNTDTDPDSSTDVSNPDPIYPYINPLTGLGTDKDLENARPLAVVIANYYVSKTNQTEVQANLSKADIIYEYPVEGNYTRLLALYSDYESVGEIGALRSARYYDIQLALGHDAIFASWGGSDLYKIDSSLLKYGAYYYFLNNLVDNLDFANDTKLTKLKLSQRNYLSNMGASSTNSVTVSGADFAAAIKELNYSTTISTAYDYAIKFSDSTVVYGVQARHVKLNVTNTRRVDFIYNGSEGVYYRYQFSDDEGLLEHYDAANNNQQLSFTNVVLLYTNVSVIKEDSKAEGNAAALDRKYVDVVGSGSGYFISAGTCTPITWKKTSESAPLKYYDASGNEIVFNPGKTCVEICSTNFKESTTIN